MGAAMGMGMGMGLNHTQTTGSSMAQAQSQPRGGQYDELYFQNYERFNAPPQGQGQDGMEPGQGMLPNASSNVPPR